MVDFQERDTRRGIDDEGEEGAGGSGEGGEGESPGDDHADHSSPADHADHSSPDDHADHHHARADELGVAVLTVSSTRDEGTDESGDAIAELCEGAGHEVATRELVEDDHDRIQKAVDTLTRRRDVDLVITTGGTGVTPDDVTPEAVEPLFEKALPGFGELFRRRSEDDVGTRIVATRATAGIAGGVPVFCLPGSEAAVRLGTGEIVLEEAGHLVHLAERGHEEE